MKIEYCPFCEKKLNLPARSSNPTTPILFACSSCSSEFYLPGILFEYPKLEQHKWLNYAYFLFLKERPVGYAKVGFGLGLYKFRKNQEIKIYISLDEFSQQYPSNEFQRNSMIEENLHNLAQTDIENRIYDDEISPRLLFIEDDQKFFAAKKEYILDLCSRGKLIRDGSGRNVTYKYSNEK